MARNAPSFFPDGQNAAAVRSRLIPSGHTASCTPGETVSVNDPFVESRLSRDLFLAWRSVAADEGRLPLIRTIAEPSPIALRARWHYLRRLRTAAANPERHAVSPEQWHKEIDLETAGDEAIRRHEPGLGRRSYTDLLEMSSHPVATVQALVGLADADRHDEDLKSAEAGYRKAGELADSIGFEFGSVRARLPLAHLVRRSGSAEQMLRVAEECEQAARELDDDVCIANALVAKGEALDMLGRRDVAVEILTGAYQLFSEVGSREGMAAAGIRLMDVHRRRRDPDAILQFAPTLLKVMGSDGPLQEAVEMHDLLADTHETRDEFDEAIAVCHEGLALAGTRYPRGSANLRRTLGTALRRSGRADEAIVHFREALQFFDGFPDERWSVALCFRHMALCAEELDAMPDAVGLHLTAIEEIESMRARQVKPRWQQEYRERFDLVYRDALLATVRSVDVPAFIAVFESLWGRRLPGVTDGVAFEPLADLPLIAQLLVREDQERRSNPKAAASQDRTDSSSRAGGRIDLAERYGEATDSALAAAYRPMKRSEGVTLGDSVSDAAAFFLVCEVPGLPRRMAWLAKAPGQTAELGQRLLSEQEVGFIDTWAVLWPHDALAEDVEPLREILPASLQSLREGTEFQLIGLEKFWALPWAATPLPHGFLGAHVELLHAPSLTLAQAAAMPWKPGLPVGTNVLGCIGPDVSHHDLRAIEDLVRDPRSSEAAAEVSKSFSGGGADAVVVLAHGRPTHGLGHYLEVGVAHTLTPVDLLSGIPPESMALLSCWGARVPGASVGEPLTLATIALARGTTQILTTVSELGDNPVAAALVNDTLWFARTHSWPSALRQAMARRAANLVSEPIVDWASLTAIGGW